MRVGVRSVAAGVMLYPAAPLTLTMDTCPR
jgi:hypothetical protein